MRSLGIIGATVTLITLVALLLDQLTTKVPSESLIILISRFLIVTIGTSSALLSTMQVQPAPIRITRFALSSLSMRRYTHEMFAASLVRDINATFPSHESRHSGTGSGVDRLFSRCIHIPSLDISRQFKARSIQAVCLRRGWRRA